MGVSSSAATAGTRRLSLGEPFTGMRTAASAFPDQGVGPAWFVPMLLSVTLSPHS
jgi:hypothetical protein